MFPTGSTPRTNSKDQLAGQPIQISYKMIKKRPCTQSGFAKKKNSRTKILLKKAQTYKKSDFGKHPMIRFYEKHILASKLFLINKETQVSRNFLWICVWEIEVWLPVFAFFDTISYIYSYVIFWFELQLVDLHGTREIYKIERYRVKEC